MFEVAQPTASRPTQPTATLPEISVVLSTYNRAETLQRTLEHLERQDLDPTSFEVLVIDDGSPDRTRDVVASFAATSRLRLEYLRHENRGPGYTQNRGIERAAAPIVLLIADDIFLAPQAVRIHLEAHRANPEPTVAVLGKVLQSPELDQSVFLRLWDPFRFNEIEEYDELPPYRFWAMNISAKRDFLVDNGMYLEERGRAGPSWMEDLELGCRLERKGLRLLYGKAAVGYHHHVVTIDQAKRRWYERGLNYGQFRKYATMPELTVHFHVLDRHTIREYFRVLQGPNWYRGKERSFAYHLLREAVRRIVLNRVTERLVFRNLIDWAERSPRIAARMRPKTYRAYLYYQFLRGVWDGRRIYGD